MKQLLGINKKIRQLFCKHKWKTISKIVDQEFDDCPDIYTTYITQQCEKCGKIREYILA